MVFEQIFLCVDRGREVGNTGFTGGSSKFASKNFDDF